jgi:chromosome segregation ATPase
MEANQLQEVIEKGFKDLHAELDEKFGKIDGHFKTLRREFAEQLDGASDGLHLELKAQSKTLLERIESVHATIEQVDSKVGLVGENVANVMKEIGRYHATVETPLETRVTTLEGRFWALDQKNSGTAAE